MESMEVCANVLCTSSRNRNDTSTSSTSTIEWRKGWDLRSGGSAVLCHNCGFAYEQSVYCEAFHTKESGWRECISCGKRLHCGCIASKSLFELLDDGAVECISCTKNLKYSSMQSHENQNGYAMTLIKNAGEIRSASIEDKIDGPSINMGKLLQMGKNIEVGGQISLLQSLRNDSNGQIKREQVPFGEVWSTGFSNLNQLPNGSCEIIKQVNIKEMLGVKNADESLSQTCLSINLGAPLGNTNLALTLSGSAIEGRDLSTFPSSYPHGQRSRNLLPRPPRVGLAIGSEGTKDAIPQVRVARPPVEGRGRNQLLPRYWPRITEEELQQISGDSNSTIVPLFEKILSASDAGRIGRLVLPKACAEAYFPPISQPEGVPIRIQDAKGKDWLFQFRFWPNNNSRMYVLEGVTPCIQSMQLQAGDTVTFSRIDPEGKLVMGFRKASNSVNLQDSQIAAIANGALGNASFFPDVIENLPIASGYAGLLQSLKGSTYPDLNAMSEHIRIGGDFSWHKTEKQGKRSNEGMQLQHLLLPGKKRSRNIGSKSKRLLIDSEAALELKLTWEDAQDLLRPPPSIKPSIVIIEDHEFEEYEEAPVFGKRTIFTSGPAGVQAQWAQCDNCSKWRRLPIDVLVPLKWTCADNVWDTKRCTCSGPDELAPKELEHLLRLDMEFKMQRMSTSDKDRQEHEPSGLDTLATAAFLGNKNGDDSAVAQSVATTTRHPRHRPGCTCIVCIQPPSGKGPKHKPTCTCNVCMTVKRRFKTLMLRKKKRQSEKEAEIALRNKCNVESYRDEIEVESSSRGIVFPVDVSENREACQAIESESASESRTHIERDLTESVKGGQLDLNSDPDHRIEELQAVAAAAAAGMSERVSMVSLLQEASLPLETYLKQNCLRSLVQHEQLQASSRNSNAVLPQAANDGESDEQPPHDDQDACIASEVPEQERDADKGDDMLDPAKNDSS
ncbi:hypothetical protein MKW98_009744 [Papaver atlanticum]|uniref:B3 domain-containing transcription repressor VAL2 n=1 Tax=Papaver atlanticum TaxID=357466 RepID=A0AAD4XM64_9MAGN|nr:hypothetical protein MKW98_009744 [Papaver atlanticum]